MNNKSSDLFCQVQCFLKWQPCCCRYARPLTLSPQTPSNCATTNTRATLSVVVVICVSSVRACKQTTRTQGDSRREESARTTCRVQRIFHMGYACKMVETKHCTTTNCHWQTNMRRWKSSVLRRFFVSVLACLFVFLWLVTDDDENDLNPLEWCLHGY